MASAKDLLGCAHRQSFEAVLTLATLTPNDCRCHPWHALVCMGMLRARKTPKHMPTSADLRGHATLSSRFSYVVERLKVTSKVIYWQQVTCFWMVTVVCGCFALFGNSFSTKSAQHLSPLGQSLPIYLAFAGVTSVGAGSIGRRGKRRRGSSGNQASDSDGIAASYSRYSSDLQREESITDQQRTCHDLAKRNGHRILPDLEYADRAVSGTKLRREGLDAMLRDAEAGKFQVLYMHSLSRLARESVITMPILKRLVLVYGVRFVSVSESIDSARDNWEMIASIMALMHERYITELGHNVFRGQEGTVLAGLAVGDHRFGYTTVPIPGSEVGRKGRNAKPRRQYVIDEAAAPWVVRIFRWFVVERRALRWITRELNRLGAPKDHRATTKNWHHQYVTNLLQSGKYIGIWPWGETKNTRDPETGQIRQEPRAEEDCEKYTRHLPHLRIIDDETFEKAQQYLQDNYDKYAANRRTNGQLRGRPGGAGSAPRHLLSQLIQCGKCASTFNVGGPHSRYLFCPGYQRGICTCQTQLQTARGERMILDAIGQRIIANSAWLDAIYQQTLKSWTKRQRQLPTELASAEQACADVERKISRLVDRIENGLDDPEIKSRLETRRAERRALAKNIESLKQGKEHRGPEPTKEWVRDQLQQLGESLNGEAPAATYALRDLVGSKIIVSEIREEDRKRFYLQGSFTIRIQSVTDVVTDAVSDATDVDKENQSLSEEIIIDFVDPNPLDGPSEKVKELLDQGLLSVEIAKELSCSKSQVTKLVKHWYESRGLDAPDGRSRRSTLRRKHLEEPLYQKIADQVMELCDQNLLLGEIAKCLACDRNTVTAAVAFWHESRGLEVPDGRTRRKELNRKALHCRRRTKDNQQGDDNISA